MFKKWLTAKMYGLFLLSTILSLLILKLVAAPILKDE